MKVAVLGAGLAGIPTAYFLAKDGHEVTVIDRQPSAAMETSFANGSLLCLGHSYPWASPAAPGILLKSLVRRDQALRISPRLDPRMWSWLLKFLAQCPRSRADRSAVSRLKLGTYSLRILEEVESATGFAFHHTSKGLLYIYRTRKSMDEGVHQMSVLQQNGLDIKIIDSNEIVRLEPALTPVKEKLIGAVYVPSDGTGDARVFTQELARYTAVSNLGVKYIYDTSVQGLDIEGGQVKAVILSSGTLSVDAVVAAMGSYTGPFLRPHGVKIDLFPVKGYSMTVPIERPDEAPVLGGLDEDNLLAFSVLGDKLRLTATAEFVGYDTSHRLSDFRYMTQAAKDLFPTIGDYSKSQYWAGLRPATPNSLPVLGPSHIANLFLNTGFGSMGWTMACGAGKIVADLVSERSPEVDVSDMLYHHPFLQPVFAPPMAARPRSHA